MVLELPSALPALRIDVNTSSTPKSPKSPVELSPTSSPQPTKKGAFVCSNPKYNNNYEYLLSVQQQHAKDGDNQMAYWIIRAVMLVSIAAWAAIAIHVACHGPASCEGRIF